MIQAAGGRINTGQRIEEEGILEGFVGGKVKFENGSVTDTQ